MVTGINTGADFAFKRPLCSTNISSQKQNDFGFPTKHANHQHEDHDHSMKLWYPRKQNLGYFRGSWSQMSSIVLTSCSQFRVKRIGFEPAYYFVKDKSVATVDKDGSDFVITAKTSGRTTLHAYNNRGKCNSALFIDVRRPRTIPVCFMFLTDSAGQKARGYTNVIDDIVNTINAILYPQTGIKIENKTPGSPDKLQPVVINRELGKTIDESILHDLSTSRNIEIQAKKICGIDCPKFIFVWKFRDQYQQGLQRGENLFIKDGLSRRRRGRVFAHELAHLLADSEGLKKFFDQAGHTNEKGHLLNELGGGTLLTRHEVSLGMYHRANAWANR